jgi:hypothetical protein
MRTIEQWVMHGVILVQPFNPFACRERILRVPVLVTAASRAVDQGIAALVCAALDRHHGLRLGSTRGTGPLPWSWSVPVR